LPQELDFRLVEAVCGHVVLLPSEGTTAASAALDPNGFGGVCQATGACCERATSVENAVRNPQCKSFRGKTA